MRISWLFWLILLLLAGCTAALWLIDPESGVGLYVLEGVLALSVVLLLLYYRTVMRPIRAIANGVFLLRGQDFSSRLAPVGQKEADRIVEMFNGMMQAIREERLRLREQNHLLDLLVGVSPMGIVMLDPSEKIVSANRAALTSLGLRDEDQIVGCRLSVLDTSRLGREVASLSEAESRTIRLDDGLIYRCTRLCFINQGAPHPFLLIEPLTQEVLQAEKAGYGKVIRIIAHEVNNSMAGVNSMLDILASSASQPDEAELLRVCEERCASLSRFINSYAEVVKIPDASLRSENLSDLLRRISAILETICVQAKVGFSLELPEEGGLVVQMDPVLLEQAILNIVKNAAESASSVEGGCVRIVLDPKNRTLVISDNGPGISHEAADKLFTPFFTTKPDGHGIGLLLVSDVLRKHSCRFSLRTHGEGSSIHTDFTIKFS